MIKKIIDWFKSLFHKVPDEILELKEIIAQVEKEKQQLQNDLVNSKHVNMWRSFCEKKCTKFINFFPYFFEEKKRTSYLEVYKKYYFWNDVHFNIEGNKVISSKLIEKF